MGIGIRIHIFEEGGVIKKIPYAKFEHLISRGPANVLKHTREKESDSP